ncbi:hypothetical protein YASMINEVIRUS_1382 [Yasminevirus sp. GU-2018]|uniref:Uncharacterized protein n=1 Tax=Yasminevirus sp. GU-2018 TaxID=2420051 RepID=A0A5K0UAY5_9VIRU|nr:hypothetical protein YASMINEVIRUS_1382 [Yasminevirus sp. GU-2018]
MTSGTSCGETNYSEGDSLTTKISEDSIDLSTKTFNSVRTDHDTQVDGFVGTKQYTTPLSLTQQQKIDMLTRTITDILSKKASIHESDKSRSKAMTESYKFLTKSEETSNNSTDSKDLHNVIKNSPYTVNTPKEVHDVYNNCWLSFMGVVRTLWVDVLNKDLQQKREIPNKTFEYDARRFCIIKPSTEFIKAVKSVATICDKYEKVVRQLVHTEVSPTVEFNRNLYNGSVFPDLKRWNNNTDSDPVTSAIAVSVLNVIDEFMTNVLDCILFTVFCYGNTTFMHYTLTSMKRWAKVNPEFLTDRHRQKTYKYLNMMCKVLDRDFEIERLYDVSLAYFSTLDIQSEHLLLPPDFVKKVFIGSAKDGMVTLVDIFRDNVNITEFVESVHSKSLINVSSQKLIKMVQTYIDKQIH